jgi:Zn-finger nucleic acid-binding protein
MRVCPRDKRILRAATIGEASVDVCGKCEGTFFDSEDLIGAAGIAADPSTWDRAETGGSVKPSELACPECETTMDAQDVTRDDAHVEIDRCGKCRGIWLDKGELDTLSAIGGALLPMVDAARAKARKELEELDEQGVDFRRRSPIEQRRFLASVALVVLAVGGIGWIAWDSTRPPPRPAPSSQDDEVKEGGCPCGCDHSTAMAAELRKKEDGLALASIEETLGTIAHREDLGYVTERMVQHRLRLLDVAGEIFDRSAAQPAGFPEIARVSEPAAGLLPTSRCRASRQDGGPLRVCPELAVHGERIERVKGEEKLIGSSFRLWLEIENRSDDPRTLVPPAIVSKAAALPIARWYREGTAGRPWDGRVAPRLDGRTPFS